MSNAKKLILEHLQLNETIKTPNFGKKEQYKKFIFQDFNRFIKENGLIDVKSGNFSVVKMKRPLGSVEGHVLGFIDAIDHDSIGFKRGRTPLVRAYLGGSTKQALTTYIHELKHAEQSVKKRMYIKDGYFYWEGKEHVSLDKFNKLSYKEYLRLPWEVEARETEKWVESYLENIENRDYLLKKNDPVLNHIFNNDEFLSHLKNGVL